ncbi:MAG: hypothetical protein PV340_00470 [Wolbachia sp.]|nr:hypothetical protein [Wolbachia sp.]
MIGLLGFILDIIISKEKYQIELERKINNNKYEESKSEELYEENRNLFKRLEEKSGELHHVSDLVNDQSFKIRKNNKHYGNNIKGLQNSLLEKSFQRGKYEEDSLDKEEEKAFFVQEVTEYSTNEAVKFIKCEMAEGYDEARVLEVAKTTKSHVKEKASQHFSHKDGILSVLGSRDHLFFSAKKT